MASSKHHMHLGVFWLGSGNHSAGWRYEGAATSNSVGRWSLPERRLPNGECSICFFISDSLVMDSGDHPSFVSRFRADGADQGLERSDALHQPRCDGIDKHK